MAELAAEARIDTGRVAYFDCFAGLAGDMALGAIIDAGCNVEALKEGLSSMSSISGEWDLQVSSSAKSDGYIVATSVKVIDLHKENHQRNLRDIEKIVREGSKLPERVRNQAVDVFRALAEAEAHVHGCSIQEVHFHEVGAIDSIIDTVGTVFGLHLLGIETLYCSSVPFTSGSVRTAHGYLPVPTPATLKLLENHIPLKSPACTFMTGELITPTGASILRTLVRPENAGKPPQHEWIIERIGVGAGSRNPPEYPNICRLFLARPMSRPKVNSSLLVVLEANIDDMSGEVAGHIMELLIGSKDVLDVWYTSIHMKKNRPGIKLSVLSKIEDADKIQRVIFAESTTIGIRRNYVNRTALHREFQKVQTRFGLVPMKLAFLDGNIVNAAPEYETVRELSQKAGVPWKLVADEAKAKYTQARLES